PWVNLLIENGNPNKVGKCSELLAKQYCTEYTTKPCRLILPTNSCATSALALPGSCIARASTPIHGYEIARQLADEAPEGLSFKQGTLYPMLRSMEADGLVKSTLVASHEGPARKCFTLTAEGRRVLNAWCETWRSTNKWVNRVLGGIDGTR
ncbi:MAG: PadR family transcriptional regulator, partial [Planctomycetes bacterium]|nr:PadR family transcriptional regulator [Planctomycetota bacterium]